MYGDTSYTKAQVVRTRPLGNYRRKDNNNGGKERQPQTRQDRPAHVANTRSQRTLVASVEKTLCTTFIDFVSVIFCCSSYDKTSLPHTKNIIYQSVLWPNLSYFKVIKCLKLTRVFFFFFRLLPFIRGRHSGCFSKHPHRNIWQCFTSDALPDATY